MNLPNGHLLQNGKYRLTEVVGQGGFGITYKGVWFTEVKGPLGTIQTEVPVCVKEYFFKDYCYREAGSFAVKVHSETGRTLFDKFKEKLIKEAKILSEVHHPYIVNVLEVFEENHTAYIAMEYISGHSLKYRLEKEGILPEATVLKYVHQVGTALQFVHEKNILHLDIKPSNILIDKNDDARLIDFGVSKRYDIEQQETSTTMLTLSKGFASIEQYDNEGTQQFSPCPDVYSLGATMYNLLTGKIPTESILRATRPLPRPTTLNSALSAKTEAAILKAMAIVPGDRFQSVAEMMEALDLPSLDVSHSAPSPQIASEPLSSLPEGDETTLLGAASSPLSGRDEEDETIVSRPEETEAPQPAKKKQWWKWILSLFVIFAMMGSAGLYWLRHNKPAEPAGQDAPAAGTAPKPQLSEAGRTSVKPEKQPADTLAAKPKQQTNALPAAGRPRQDEKKREADKAKPVQQPTEPTVTVKPQEPAEPADRKAEERHPSEAEIEARYANLLAAGRAQMEAGDYQAAKQLLTEAKQTKLTEEVVRLLIANDEKAEAKRIADRKAMYEEKMDFGQYKIVRKKSSGRYGAIDAKGEERIPCKYLSVGKADNGRAFERPDNLFDIYKSDGSLAVEGATYY